VNELSYLIISVWMMELYCLNFYVSISTLTFEKEPEIFIAKFVQSIVVVRALR